MALPKMLPGFRLVDGSLINRIIDIVNGKALGVFYGAHYGTVGPNGARQFASTFTTLTMVAGATTKAQVAIPAGCTGLSVGYATGVAFTGTPTNINLTIGSTDGGAEIMAAVDVKATSNAAGVIVAANSSLVIAPPSIVFLQIAAVGGTAPAGATQVRVSYHLGTGAPA